MSIYNNHSVGQCMLLFIFRTINGEKKTFMSARIAETQLLSKYMHYLNLNLDLYTCTSVRDHFIEEAEAKLINEFNSTHWRQVRQGEYWLGQRVRRFSTTNCCATYSSAAKGDAASFASTPSHLFLKVPCRVKVYKDLFPTRAKRASAAWTDQYKVGHLNWSCYIYFSKLWRY